MSGVAGDGGTIFYVVLFVVTLVISTVLGLVARGGYRVVRRGWTRCHQPDPEAERDARIEVCLTGLERSGVNVSELLGDWLPARHRA